jgi:hypothetical protein
MATKNEIVNILEILYTAYDKPIDEQIVKLYINTLNDLPASALETAAYQHIKTSKWFPKIGELRHLAERVPNEAKEKASEDYRMTLDDNYQPSPVDDIIPAERLMELDELNKKFERGEYKWIDGELMWLS